MGAVAILSSGMVTGVGLDAPASCAAIRVGITGFVETHFMFAGEWLIGCPVPFEEPWRGREKLLRMVVPAIEECLAGLDGTPTQEIPLLLCLAELNRPGRFAGLDDSFLEEVQARLGRRFHPESTIIAKGRIGGVDALDRARELLAARRPYCVIAGVDTLLVAQTLAAYEAKARLQTGANSDGFIPGEAAAALLVGPVRTLPEPQLMCVGVGYGTEPAAVDSGEPLRADGLVAAFKEALGHASITLGAVDCRLTDLSGEQYGFKEAALALTRTLRERKAEFDIWHPADCIGEVGAAIVPVVLAVALAAHRKEYAPGPRFLCHFAADGSERAAMILDYAVPRAA